MKKTIKHVFKLEPISKPLLPHHLWLKRVYRAVHVALAIVFVALGIGVLGYHTLGHLNWVDSLLEASMILGGMGPVAHMDNDAVKIFASVYALLSGFVIIMSSSVILAPWVHRLLHLMHADK